MAEFRLSPAAQHDLDQIFDFTVVKWGRDQALRYVDLIESTCAGLAEAPMRATGCDHIRPGYRRRRAGRHIIYFRVVNGGISVIRILYERMNAQALL